MHFYCSPTTWNIANAITHKAHRNFDDHKPGSFRGLSSPTQDARSRGVHHGPNSSYFTAIIEGAIATSTFMPIHLKELAQ
jgi:hypothetical protein